jgi:methyl-accepting chemotaxis protein
MTEGNVKNIRPRYLVALAIMALACATIVAVSIRSSDENARISALSDALARADFELNELAQMSLRLTNAKVEAARQAYDAALETRIADTEAVLKTLQTAWLYAPEGLKAQISASSYASGGDPFKIHWDLIVQGNQIFGGSVEAENQNATRLASSYRLLNLPLTKEYEAIVRNYSKDAAEAVAMFNYGFAAAVAAMLAGIGLFIFVPMERTIRRQIVQMSASLEQVRAVGQKAARVQSALNDASSAALIVGSDGQVAFANKAMVRLAESVAEDLADELEGFADVANRAADDAPEGDPGEGDGTEGHGGTADTVDEEVDAGSEDLASNQVGDTAASDGPERYVLTGLQFDRLHSVEAMRTANLMEADEPITARMVIGGRTIELTASPVFDEAGDRLGSVVEWRNLTDRVAVEREIAGIVHSAGEGDFSKRLTEANKNGFMADLARGMNEVLDVVDNGLSQTVRVISALAEGDLTERMQGDHKGAFATLKDDVDRMANQMEAMLGRIAGVSNAVHMATNDISSGIADLSMRTEHQASSLEETTASMEELSATVRQNADNAQEANHVAAAAREAAASGGEVTGHAVHAMVTIEASSKKITEIVGLIQEIAFQTNLLALNASVEAARAGEAGRGFSVVANEVRALAQRAAAASKDIKELITSSDSQVQEGVRLVNEAGTALEEIVTSVRKVADYVSDIASASQEQTSGIDQVSAAISGMDEMTQQNAALVEETTAALQSAREQVDDLMIAVGAFRTTGGKAAGHAGNVDGPGHPLHDMAARMARQSGPGSDGMAPVEEVGAVQEIDPEAEWEAF